ncbi:MAG: LysR family transcriptional regulator [Proteobacteria bacterium]|nr:LysR family transcriptional regulator [Pseudomonadota bacterium]
MLDRVTGMQVFVRVASLGSLSAAARAMNMSQTMATKHVAALESRLGVRLLQRTTRRLTLTEAGRNYLEAAERILIDLDEADAKAAAETVHVQGTLRLNVPVSFGIRQLAPLLARLSARHPDLSIDLGLNDRFVDLVDEGWDLAIRIGRLTQASHIAKRLAPCRTRICAAPSYLARRGTPRTVAELAAHDCLGYTLAHTVGHERWAFGRAGDVTVPVKGSLIANNGDVLVAAAIAGQGIVYQPTFLVHDAIASGALVSLDLDHPTVELDGVFAIYPAGPRPSAKVRATIDFLAEAFSSTPPWERW